MKLGSRKIWSWNGHVYDEGLVQEAVNLDLVNDLHLGLCFKKRKMLYKSN